MKVILVEKVPTLGNIGDLINVTPGHARNFLLPKKLAVVADEKNKAALTAQKKRLSKKIEAQKAIATEVKNKLEGVTLEFVKKIGASGKLFGSITNAELAKVLTEEKGLEVERRTLVIETPIRTLGTFNVRAKLFTDVEATFQVKVIIDPEQQKELKAQEIEAKQRKAEKAIKDAAAAEAAAKEAAAAQQDEE